MPLSGATQGQHNWWTKGLVGSRRTLRNWTRGWTTVKSMAQEGKKVKRILPTTPSRSTDRKTSRNNRMGLKPAKDFWFFFTPFPLNSFFLSVLSFFILSSFHPLPFLFLLMAFFNFFCLIFVKIPSSYLSSDFFYSYFLLSFPFVFPFSLLPFSGFFFPSSFSFSHRWDNKTWSTEKTSVRPC